MAWNLKSITTDDDMKIYNVEINNPCCVGKLYQYIEMPDGSMTLNGAEVSEGVKSWLRKAEKELK